MRRWWGLFLIVVVPIAGALGWQLASVPLSDDAVPLADDPPAASRGESPASIRSRAQEHPTDERAVPQTAPSQRGTEPDGAVRFDASGSLQIDRSLRRRFDYELAAAGERAPDQIRSRFEGELTRSSGATRAAQVLAVYDRYLGCLKDSAAIDPALALSARLEALHAVRVRDLGESTARVFYDDEESEDAAALKLRALAERNDLTAEARAQAQAELERSLSPAAAQLQADHQAVVDAIAQTRALDQAGATPEQRQAAREEKYGPEAAQRFAELDQQRARWSQTLEQFRHDVATLQADSSLTAAQRASAIDQALATHPEPEQRRLRALVLGASP